MNTRITALALTAATALSLTPKSALAGDKEWAAVGGFLGGIILGAAIADNHHDTYSHTGGTTVIVRDRDDRCEDNDGYWDTVSVSVWVPGDWVYRRDCGRRVRIYIPGHYEDRHQRVWVSHSRRHDRHGHDRYADNRHGRHDHDYRR